MNKKRIALTALLIASLIIGCGIATGTFTFGYELNGTIESSNASLEFEYVDLTTIDDYNDHKDNLKSVDNIAVVGSIINDGVAAVSGEIWLVDNDTTYTDPDTVKHYGTRIFVSPVIPAGDTLDIDWSDGLSYIENFSAVQTAVELGQFVLYGLGDSDAFEVTMDIDIIFTITAGL